MLPDLDDLEELFKKMNRNGFNTEEPLKWGFFFLDETKSNFEKLYEELKDHGYKVEKLTLDKGEWALFVSKIDTLTPLKLHKRNIAFNQLAEHCNVSSYDGWDVEKL